MLGSSYARGEVSSKVYGPHEVGSCWEENERVRQKKGWSSSVQLVSEARCNKSMKILQLVSPIEVSGDKIKELGISNMTVGEVVVLNQKKPSIKEEVINPGIEGGTKVLEGNIMEAV